MNLVIVLLFAFVVLGLLEPVLGRRMYPAMGLMVVAFVLYAYHTG